MIGVGLTTVSVFYISMQSYAALSNIFFFKLALPGALPPNTKAKIRQVLLMQE
jgi:hypothetical protein